MHIDGGFSRIFLILMLALIRRGLQIRCPALWCWFLRFAWLSRPLGPNLNHLLLRIGVCRARHPGHHAKFEPDE